MLRTRYEYVSCPAHTADTRLSVIVLSPSYSEARGFSFRKLKLDQFGCSNLAFM